MHILYVAPMLSPYLDRLHALVTEGDTLDTLPRLTADDSPRLAAADVLITLGGVTAQSLASAPKLRLVQVLGAGHDGVDLDAAKRAGIRVATTGNANAVSVAEHALALILSVRRRLLESDRSLRQGDWTQLERYSGGIFELTGKTLGLVGFGNVGRALARMTAGFDMRVLYTAHSPVADEKMLGVSYASLHELLAAADVVSVQVPLSSDTLGLIGATELACMKPSAILVNTARGGIVDEQALARALRDGRLAGAGLDVFAREPVGGDSPLLDSDRVVLTPHMGGAAQEAIDRTFAVAFDNVRRLKRGEPLRNEILGCQLEVSR